MRRFGVALAVVISIASASAAVVRPAELNGVIAATKPYGTASLTWLLFMAYEASLWTDAATWSMDAPFALSLTYEMSFTRAELVERTLQEMRRVSPELPAATLARFEEALNKAYPAVKSGDRITALYVPNAPVRFFHNGRPTHEVAEAGFATPFFGIWLSPRTSEPALRAGLLNLKR